MMHQVTRQVLYLVGCALSLDCDVCKDRKWVSPSSGYPARSQHLPQHRCSPHVMFNLLFHNILSLSLPPSLSLFLSVSRSLSLSLPPFLLYLSLPPFLLSLSGFHKSSLSKLYASFLACSLHPVSSENHLWSLCQSHSLLCSWSLCPWLEVWTLTGPFFQPAVNYSYLYKQVSLPFFRFSRILTLR